MRLGFALIPLVLAGCATSREAVRESFLSDKPAAGVASCIATGMSWAGLPADMVSDAGRTVVSFREAQQVFATATVIAGDPTVVDLRGQFGARIRRGVEACL